ncbi:MAG: hypothetical protein GXP54_09725 [Deltaproteobacteria bacterium]|nr:hypothetical protein [Deltaproteobacteria bacterium]
MFDILIIKKIEEEQERRRKEAERPRLSVPSLGYMDETPPGEHDDDGTAERGVVIIEPDEP